MPNKTLNFSNAVSLRQFLNDNITNPTNTNAQWVPVLQRGIPTNIFDNSKSINDNNFSWCDIENIQLIWTGNKYLVSYDDIENPFTQDCQVKKYLIPFDNFFWRIQKKKMVTINFNPNGGTCIRPNIIIEANTQIPYFPLNEPDIYYDDHIFLGWLDKETGQELLDFSSSSDFPQILEKGNTYEAIWAESKQTIYFNAENADAMDGNGETDYYTTKIEINYNDQIDSITNLPIRTKYNFDGYYDENGIQYYNENGEPTKVNWDKRSSTTLYAHWSPLSQ